jgi:DNA repair exonuclease SbcCD nuclease subunit
MTGKKTIRVLHTSDMHLMSLGDKACNSLEALVNLADKLDVNLVIIAGDFFDHNRVTDSLVRFALEQLRHLPVDVVILAGNHDCLVPESVYHREGVWEELGNVHILREPDGEILDLPHLGVSLWGRSIDSYASGIDPLDGIPQRRRNGYWHIAVAHGYYVGGKPRYLPSLPITDEELANSGWDYIALGHWPVFRCVCEEPKAYYCDSPSWTFPSSTVNIVDFTEEGVKVYRYPLSDEPDDELF